MYHVSLVVQVFSADNLRNHNWYKYPLCTGSVLYILIGGKKQVIKRSWIQIEKLINLVLNMFIFNILIIHAHETENKIINVK